MKAPTQSMIYEITAPAGPADPLQKQGDIQHFPFQKLAKGAEEDIAGNYFKPVRASRLMKQVQENQRSGSKYRPHGDCLCDL